MSYTSRKLKGAGHRPKKMKLNDMGYPEGFRPNSTVSLTPEGQMLLSIPYDEATPEQLHIQNLLSTATQVSINLPSDPEAAYLTLRADQTNEVGEKPEWNRSHFNKALGKYFILNRK